MKDLSSKLFKIYVNVILKKRKKKVTNWSRTLRKTIKKLKAKAR